MQINKDMEESKESKASEVNQLKETIASLRSENRALSKEVEFYQSLWNSEHSMTVIAMLFRKSKQGEPVWINLQQTNLRELKSLDPDPDVERWIQEEEGINEIVFET